MLKRNHFKNKKNNDQSGQAIIEFLIVIIVILTMIFVFIQLSWAIGFSHYVHYATFMSSRAYYSGAATKTEQFESAAAVLRTMLKNPAGQDLLPFIAKARTGDERDISSGAEPVKGAFIGTHPEAEGNENTRAFSWAEGVQYNFNVPIFLMPLATWVKDEGKGKSIRAGTEQEPTKAIEFKGAIPFTSDSFLGRESTYDECLKEITRITNSIGRGDGQEFIEDNGC